jgi:transcriptional regulator with XRE-family HTH domain
MPLAAVWTMEFPECLRHLRKQKGLTQKALADAVGMSPIQISRFDAEEKKVVKAVLDSLILKQEAKRWAAASQIGRRG